MTRRTLFKLAVVACMASLAGTAQAQDWPGRKPITLIAPFTAGGSTDATARLLANALGKELGQQVVVDNRAGAGGNVGSALVAKSAPDGYTLLIHTSTLATNVSLYKNMGFDVRKDLVPVSQFALIPNVLMVNADVPAKTLQEFVAYVQQKKAPISYGSAGNGSASHLSGALFNSLAKGEMQHVPYKGGAQANTDLMGGQIQAVFAPLVEVLPYIESKKLRALAVTTRVRSPRLPDVPAVAEALPGYEIALWNGIFVPAGTPPAIVDRLAAAIRKVAQDPAVRKALAEQGTTPVGSTPAEFKKLLDAEIDNWARLVKLSGATVE